MLVLAIETSGAVASVAVLDGNHALSELTEPTRSRKSDVLLPLIERALEAAGVVPADLGLIAVG
ncbi:MAG: tRNA (adenosine(37)-N6)-threonylcarbamoyltransferase complex dimerization subunit type 1 TsaB, partial [Polyangiaceae bacterium]|nr:tRNA (adenosine(37)-N6)-threonylcarbamoyltransferase complex dimerization subunit type 1 TsaB [Polyangiaceae bacterium]